MHIYTPFASPPDSTKFHNSIAEHIPIPSTPRPSSPTPPSLPTYPRPSPSHSILPPPSTQTPVVQTSRPAQYNLTTHPCSAVGTYPLPTPSLQPSDGFKLSHAHVRQAIWYIVKCTSRRGCVRSSFFDEDLPRADQISFFSSAVNVEQALRVRLAKAGNRSFSLSGSSQQPWVIFRSSIGGEEGGGGEWMTGFHSSRTRHCSTSRFYKRLNFWSG